MEQINDQVGVLSETLKGKVVISVKDEVWRQGEDNLKWAIVLKLTVSQARRIAGLSTVLRKAWQMTKEATFMEIPNAMVVVRFNTRAQLERAWDGGPWSFMGDFVRMQRWFAGCEPSTMKFDKIQIWLQIHRLPVELINEKVAQGIAAMAGKVIRCEQQVADVVKFRFFRVKVEIDLALPLATGCFLDRNDKEPRWLAFKYERLPKYCFDCGVLGHESSKCESENKSASPIIGLRSESLSIIGPDGKELTDADNGGYLTDDECPVAVSLAPLSSRADNYSTIQGGAACHLESPAEKNNEDVTASGALCLGDDGKGEYEICMRNGMERKTWAHSKGYK